MKTILDFIFSGALSLNYVEEPRETQSKTVMKIVMEVMSTLELMC